MKSRYSLSYKPTRRQGFTLIEMTFATAIMSLLLVGAMNLFITSARTTLQVNAHISANLDASNAVQQVIGLTREAQSFSLPNETPANGGAFVVPMGFNAASLQTTLSGENIYTALELLQPVTQTVTVKNSSNATVTVTPAPLSRDGAAAAILLIYRGDANGTADAAAGPYLWEYSVQDNGASVNKALCKSIDTNSANAVQFVRPYVGNPAQPQPYDVEMKVISSYYSLAGGQQTNEETNGSSSSQLSGKCVLMRDHANGLLTGGSNQNTTNNAFHYQPQ